MKKPLPFGKYYLLERINVGGMAEVFKAKSFGVEGFERIVAVKRILPSIAEDQEFITMFIDEAKVAVQLTHANIAQIFDLGKVGDSYFIAMEYVHGRDLRAIFDRARKNEQPLPIPMACYTTMKVCEGLDYAHNKKDAAGRDLNLVHRDVSPQNILISYDGEVKVIDFGIAKAACRSAKTQAGILKGKFGYMSPEQVRGLPLDRRSDIFSVGIVLYELLTLERLFQGESDFSTLEKVRNVEIMPPSTYNPRIPEELEQIVLKALSKEVEDRYQTAMDLHDDLQSFMYTSGNFFARKDLAAYVKNAFPESDLNPGAGVGLSLGPGGESRPPSLSSGPSQITAPAGPNRAGQGLGRIPGGNAHSRRASSPPSAVRASAPPPPPRPSAPPQPPRAVPLAAGPEGLSPDLIALTHQPYLDGPPLGISLHQPQAVSPAGIPQDLAAGPVATPLPEDSQPPSLDMDWDDDELATQVYDKPSEFSQITPSEPEPIPAVRPSSHRDAFARGVTSDNGGSVGTLITGETSPPPAQPRHRPSGPHQWHETPSGGVAVVPRALSEGPNEKPVPLFPVAAKELRISEPPPAERASGVSRGSIALVVVLVLLLAAGVTYALWLLRNRPGTISGTVHPATAQVLLGDEAIEVTRDGRFAISNLAPGSYLLHFRADGFQAQTETVTVEPGGASPVAVVLGGGGEGGSGPGSPTGVAVRVLPEGASIFINGVKRRETTPVEQIALPPGNYTVRVEKEGYLSLTDRVTVSEGYVVTLSRRLQPEQMTVNFDLSPSNARCTLNQQGQAAEQVSETFTVMPHRNPTLTCSARGYRQFSGPVRLPTDGTTVAAFTVTLESEDAAASASPQVTERGRDTSNGTRRARAAKNSPPPEAEPSGGSREPQAEGPGYLFVNTRPWTKVYVDDRFIRNTPLLRHELPAGQHRLKLVNEDFNINETIAVRVVSGEKTAIVRNLVR